MSSNTKKEAYHANHTGHRNNVKAQDTIGDETVQEFDKRRAWLAASPNLPVRIAHQVQEPQDDAVPLAAAEEVTTNALEDTNRPIVETTNIRNKHQFVTLPQSKITSISFSDRKLPALVGRVWRHDPQKPSINEIPELQRRPTYLPSNRTLEELHRIRSGKLLLKLRKYRNQAKLEERRYGRHSLPSQIDIGFQQKASGNESSSNATLGRQMAPELEVEERRGRAPNREGNEILSFAEFFKHHLFSQRRPPGAHSPRGPVKGRRLMVDYLTKKIGNQALRSNIIQEAIDAGGWPETPRKSAATKRIQDRLHSYLSQRGPGWNFYSPLNSRTEETDEAEQRERLFYSPKMPSARNIHMLMEARRVRTSPKSGITPREDVGKDNSDYHSTIGSFDVSRYENESLIANSSSESHANVSEISVIDVSVNRSNTIFSTPSGFSGGARLFLNTTNAVSRNEADETNILSNITVDVRTQVQHTTGSYSDHQRPHLLLDVENNPSKFDAGSIIIELPFTSGNVNVVMGNDSDFTKSSNSRQAENITTTAFLPSDVDYNTTIAENVIHASTFILNDTNLVGNDENTTLLQKGETSRAAAANETTESSFQPWNSTFDESGFRPIINNDFNSDAFNRTTRASLLNVTTKASSKWPPKLSHDSTYLEKSSTETTPGRSSKTMVPNLSLMVSEINAFLTLSVHESDISNSTSNKTPSLGDRNISTTTFVNASHAHMHPDVRSIAIAIVNRRPDVSISKNSSPIVGQGEDSVAYVFNSTTATTRQALEISRASSTDTVNNNSEFTSGAADTLGSHRKAIVTKDGFRNPVSPSQPPVFQSTQDGSASYGSLTCYGTCSGATKTLKNTSEEGTSDLTITGSNVKTKKPRSNLMNVEPVSIDNLRTSFARNLSSPSLRREITTGNSVRETFTASTGTLSQFLEVGGSSGHPNKDVDDVYRKKVHVSQSTKATDDAITRPRPELVEDDEKYARLPLIEVPRRHQEKAVEHRGAHSEDEINVMHLTPPTSAKSTPEYPYGVDDLLTRVADDQEKTSKNDMLVQLTSKGNIRTNYAQKLTPTTTSVVDEQASPQKISKATVSAMTLTVLTEVVANTTTHLTSATTSFFRQKPTNANSGLNSIASDNLLLRHPRTDTPGTPTTQPNDDALNNAGYIGGPTMNPVEPDNEIPQPSTSAPEQFPDPVTDPPSNNIQSIFEGDTERGAKSEHKKEEAHSTLRPKTELTRLTKSRKYPAENPRASAQSPIFTSKLTEESPSTAPPEEASTGSGSHAVRRNASDAPAANRTIQAPGTRAAATATTTIRTSTEIPASTSRPTALTNTIAIEPSTDVSATTPTTATTITGLEPSRKIVATTRKATSLAPGFPDTVAPFIQTMAKPAETTYDEIVPSSLETTADYEKPTLSTFRPTAHKRTESVSRRAVVGSVTQEHIRGSSNIAVQVPADDNSSEHLHYPARRIQRSGSTTTRRLAIFDLFGGGESQPRRRRHSRKPYKHVTHIKPSDLPLPYRVTLFHGKPLHAVRVAVRRRDHGLKY